MKELPKYAFLTNSVGFTGMKVISLTYPFIVASIYEVNKNRPDLVDGYLEDMAQGRYPIAKVKGYSIFLKVYTSLEPCRDTPYMQAVLNEMAQFVLTERIEKKPGQFKGMKEE